VRNGDVLPGAAWPRPVRPGYSAELMYRLHAFLEPNRFYRAIASWLVRRPRLYGWFTEGERVVKERMFGCRMCGQCALPATGYGCPMTCPKQLRNGPCGGVSPTGRCEVYPELSCVWVVAFERADRAGHGEDLDLLQRPVDHQEFGRSSWLNYWQGRDLELWVAPTPERPRPLLRRELGLEPR
jgi:hypothetical protein